MMKLKEKPLKELFKSPSKEKKPTKEKTLIRKPSQEEIIFKQKFYNLMFELDLYNKFKKTYYLKILQETNYGYYAQLYLSPGLSYDELEKKRITIEQNLNCMFIIKTETFRGYGVVKIVIKPIDESIEFSNPHIKPYEMYLGMSFSNQLQKTNVNDNCMMLLAGATGTGKTRFIYQILLSWILSCSPNEVWIYLSDIAKNEYIQFKDVKHVKYYAAELNDLHEMMKQVTQEFERRKKIISNARENGIATNITEYNKVSKNKLAYSYVVIDELSILLPDKTDSKGEKEIKEFILDTLKRISKLGRSLGIYTFVATQKTTKDEMPSILKNMSATRISFRANDLISSEVIMGNDSAVGLPTRVAVYSLNGGSSTDYLYSPKLITEDGKLQELLAPFIEKKKSIKTYNNKDLKKEKKDDDTWKITIIPKGVDGMEYLKSLKEKNKKKEDEYIDY